MGVSCCCYLFKQRIYIGYRRFGLYRGPCFCAFHLALLLFLQIKHHTDRCELHGSNPSLPPSPVPSSLHLSPLPFESLLTNCPSILRKAVLMSNEKGS